MIHDGIYALIREGDRRKTSAQPMPLSDLFAVEQSAIGISAEQAILRLIDNAQNHPDRERIGRILVNWGSNLRRVS